MKKKISLLLCVLLASLCFVGCSANDKEETADIESMTQVAEAMISNFSGMAEEELAQFKDVSDFQLDYTMMTVGLPIEAEDFVNMIKSWEAAKQECGAYVEHGEYKSKVTSAGVVISTDAIYEERNATIDFHFDHDGNLESMDVSADYSLKEILGKAGLNTLLGMGVVFSVLIALAFIISGMKYIPSFMEKFKEDSTGPVQETVVAEEAVVVPTNVNLTDDLELVAVITAAIAAQMGSSSDGFVVRSIKRRPSNRW